MRTTYQALLLLMFVCIATYARAQINTVPRIENLKESQQGIKEYDFLFDLYDADNDTLEVIAQFSFDGGYTYLNSANIFTSTGDIGAGIRPGTNKKISLKLLGQPLSGSVMFRVTVLDHKTLDIAGLVAQIDSNELKQTVQYLAKIRHRTAGATHLKQVQDSIGQLFTKHRLSLKEDRFTYQTNYTARNILGHKSGYSALQQTVLVGAHYDSVSNSPGADDNATGTAAVLALAELLAPYPAQRGLRFAGFDLEETGLTGSTHYVNQLAATDTIAAFFNFEMIGVFDTMIGSQTLPTGFNQLFPAAYQALVNDGFRGNFITNVGNTASQELVDQYRNAAKNYVPSLKVIDVVTPGTGSLTPDLRRSDHAPFWSTGRKAIMITDGSEFRYDQYHTPSDLVKNLHFGFMQAVTQASAAAIIESAGVVSGCYSIIPVVTSSTISPDQDLCDIKIFRQKEACLMQLADCNLGVLHIEIFAINGQLIANTTTNGDKNGQIQIPIPNTSTDMSVLVVRVSDINNRLVAAQKI
jgi:Zn-dependent M28 family amino/carboxypeptidase